MSHADPGEDQDSPVRPLLAGDWVDGRQVLGFAWDGASGERRSTHLDDRLLLDGDQELTSPPARSVPQTADGAELKAVMPPGDLPECRRPGADSIDATMRWRADALLNTPGAMWQPVIRPLLVGVLAAGHRLWLSGGAAREVVSGAALREVNDLDLAGTVPTGRFSDIAYQTMRATQMSEYRVRVEPESLVCSIVTPKSLTPKEERTVIEYRGLNLGGFGFPAVGSEMEEDSRHRDLSFNTLFYDVLAHVVIDASGNGLTDLNDGPRRFRPQVTAESRIASALVLVRALKFAVRWYDTIKIELEPLLEWSSTLPADFADCFSAEEWVRLTETYETNVLGRTELQRRFADELSGPARSFIDKLIEGAE